MMYRIYWIAFLALARYEIMRIFRIWSQAFLPAIINTLLYFIIFGEIMGQRVGTIYGMDYVQFIAPGLVMMTIITSSYTNVVSSFYICKFQRSIEEILTSPMPPTCMMLAYITGGVVRALIAGLLVLLVSAFFTSIIIENVTLTLTTAILTACLFSQAGFSNALKAKHFDDTAIIITFVLTPMIYLGGVFYSISFLNETWQAVSFYNPILYIVNTLRYAMIGVSDVAISYSLLGLLIANVLLFLINRHLLIIGYGIRD